VNPELLYKGKERGKRGGENRKRLDFFRHGGEKRDDDGIDDDDDAELEKTGGQHERRLRWVCWVRKLSLLDIY
jgi:hypothetical protein